MLLHFYWDMKANNLIEERPTVGLPHAAAPSTLINRFGRRKRRHDMDGSIYFTIQEIMQAYLRWSGSYPNLVS